MQQIILAACSGYESIKKSLGSVGEESGYKQAVPGNRLKPPKMREDWLKGNIGAVPIGESVEFKG